MPKHSHKAPKVRAPSQLPALSRPAVADSSAKLSAALSDALAQLDLPGKSSLSPIKNPEKGAGSHRKCAETLTKRSSRKKAGQHKHLPPTEQRAPKRKIKKAGNDMGDTSFAAETEDSMKAALARVGVDSVSDLLENGVSGAAGPIFLSKRTRRRHDLESHSSSQSAFATGPKKLRQLRKVYSTEQKRQKHTQRVVKASSRQAIPMVNAAEGREALEELLECLAQRQMQTVQLQRMMLGELKFRRDPNRLSSLIQEIGTLEAQLCETEEELLQTLKQCEWFLLKNREGYGEALAKCAQEVVAELTDEATNAYNENASKAHEDEWRLRIGVFLHSVPRIEDGGFESLVQHVAASRKDFTDVLAIFVETGRLNANQRQDFEKLTQNMQSEAQVAMEMSWRLRDAQRRRRAQERNQELPIASHGSLLVELQKASQHGSPGSAVGDAGASAASKQQRKFQFKKAEIAVQDGIEDVRSGIRDMIAKVRTRRQLVTAPTASKSVPASPAKPRAFSFSGDEQILSPKDSESCIKSPPTQAKEGFITPSRELGHSPLTVLSSAGSSLVTPLRPSTIPPLSGSGDKSELFSISTSRFEPSDTGTAADTAQYPSPTHGAAAPGCLAEQTDVNFKGSAGASGEGLAGDIHSEIDTPPEFVSRATLKPPGGAGWTSNTVNLAPSQRSPIVSPRAGQRLRFEDPGLDTKAQNTVQQQTSPLQGKSGLWNTQLMNRSSQLPSAPSATTSPLQQFAAQEADESSPQPKTTVDSHSPMHGLWRPPELTSSEKREQSSGTNWSQTQMALQAVMQQAAYVPPSESVVLKADRAALADLKRRHGALSSAIDVALKTVEVNTKRVSPPSKPERSAKLTTSLTLKPEVARIWARLCIRNWAFHLARHRRWDRRWRRDQEQSRWYQLTQLRSSSASSHKPDKYDRAVLVLRRFCLSVPFRAQLLFRRSLRQLGRRRALKGLFADSQALHPELDTTVQAQDALAQQASTLVQAARDLQEQSRIQYLEQLETWRQQLLKGLLSERLPHNWEVQHENSHETRVPKLSLLVHGEGFVEGVSYVNTKTAASRKTHPNMKLVKRIYKQEADRTESLISEAEDTILRFAKAVAVGRSVLSSRMQLSMADFWQALQGNQAIDAYQAQPHSSDSDDDLNDEESPPAHKQGKQRPTRVAHSPLIKPQKPSFTLAELDEDHLYGQSQIAPQLTRSSSKPSRRRNVSKPVQVAVENRTVLSNMIADTKSRLTALLAKAMQ